MIPTQEMLSYAQPRTAVDLLSRSLALPRTTEQGIERSDLADLRLVAGTSSTKFVAAYARVRAPQPTRSRRSSHRQQPLRRRIWRHQGRESNLARRACPEQITATRRSTRTLSSPDDAPSSLTSQPSSPSLCAPAGPPSQSPWSTGEATPRNAIATPTSELQTPLQR